MSFIWHIWKFCNKYAYLVPPIHLLSAFILSFYDMTSDLAICVGVRTGVSDLILVPYFAYYLNPIKKYCLFTYVSLAGVFSQIVLNEFGTYVSYAQYSQIYDRWTFVLSLGLSIILGFVLKKKWFHS